MKRIKFKTKTGLLISGSFFQFPSKSEKNIANFHNVVLIHAFPFDSDMFIHNFIKKNFIQDFDKIAVNGKILRIFIPNLPGFGESDILPSKPKNLSPYVESIKEMVDKYQIKRFFLGGCSMGGYISLEYFRNYPDDIKGLILIDTNPFADNEEQLENRTNTMNLINMSLQTYREEIRSEIKMKNLYEKDDKIKEYINNLYLRIISNDTRRNRLEIAEKILDLMQNQKAISYVQGLSGMAGRKDTFEVIKSTEVPILIIVGENDSITPVDIARHIYNAVEHGYLEIISNAGHLSNLENRDQFNQILLNWIFLK